MASKTSFYSNSGVKSEHTDAIEAAIANAEHNASLANDSAVSANSSLISAQTAQAHAETAETNAETAQAIAEAARDASIVAKDQSVVAKVASETAQTASETAKGLAETAAQNAASSASSATTNGAYQVSLATDQVALATTQANLATTNGAAQVALATTQVGIATTKANEAATSASNIAATELTAQANALAASQSAAAAATALDQFDDRYLGSKSAEPTLDNDGNALVQGALYFSSSSASMQVYDGANWIAASSSGVSSLDQFEYTATANQTVFTGTDDHGLAMSFISANILVTLNGIILDSSDYTSANGISITLDEVAAVGDLLNVYAFKSFQIADTVSATTGGTFNGQVTFGANTAFNSNATFADNTKLKIGNSGDMELYHNGVNSFISDFGQGKLIFSSNGSSLDIYDNANGHTMAEFKNNAGVKLKHQGSTKIETTSTGVDISGNIRLEDNEKIYFGNSDDFQLYHDSNNSYIHETGTGNLIIRADQFDVKTSDSSQYKIRAITNGGVSLYNAGAVKLTTNASGVTVSGALNATTLTGDGSALTGMFSGDYNSLSNKPTIPSNNNQLSNGAGYLTSSSSLNSSRLTGALPAISGANLTGIEGVPQGVIVMWSGQTTAIPTGWALCDGSNGTPNLIDKFIMGASSSNETTTGGANSRTLSTANLPSHTHSFSGTTNTTGNHNHSGSTNTTGNHHHLMVTPAMSNSRAQYSITTNSGNYLAGAGGHGYEMYYLNGHTSAPTGGKTSTSGNHSHSLSINNNGNHSHTMSGTTGGSGSGTAFDNKPAYMALAYIMKT